MNKTALVVGISNYPGSIPKLSASVGEATLWAKVLNDNQFSVLPPLYNGSATHANVRKGLDSLLKNARSGDELAFIFCGHGTIIDVEGPSGTHAEEALYLYPDTGVAEAATLTDTDLANIVLNAELPPDATFAIIADCCHAAGLGGVPPGARAQFVDLLTDAEKAKLGPEVVFGTLSMVPIASPVGRPIIVAACHRDQNAIQEPAIGKIYRLLFSHRALDELNKNLTDTYDDLVGNIKPLSSYVDQEPEIVGNTTKSGEHFVKAPPPQRVETLVNEGESSMRTITVRIAGTCCFVDPKDQNQSFRKRVVLPFDDLSAIPAERHIPYVEVPDASILECRLNGAKVPCDDILVKAYKHVVPGGPGTLLYRRFELSEHVFEIENIDSSSADLVALSSFDSHVPKMRKVLPTLDYHPRDECFEPDPYLPLAAAFFDISKGILKAGTLYEFVTRFVKRSLEPTAKYQTPEFVELLLPITTAELTLTFTTGNEIRTVLLDERADTITLGNQPEADITGVGSGDDVSHHFKLYYKLATNPPQDPALPEVDADPVASCTATNWP